MKTKKPKYPIVIAIDPGASGACAVLLDDGARACAFPFKGEVDFVELMQDYSALAKKEKREVHVFIEKVGGFIAGNKTPGSAMFNFGRNAGFQIGVCQALGFRIEEVPPATWQKLFPCKTKRRENGAQHKRELREYAAKIFPELRPTLATADALLILYYAIGQTNYRRLPPDTIF